MGLQSTRGYFWMLCSARVVGLEHTLIREIEQFPRERGGGGACLPLGMMIYVLCNGFDAVEETARTERAERRFLTGLTLNHLCGDSPAGSRSVLRVTGLLFALQVGRSLAAQFHWENIVQ